MFIFSIPSFTDVSNWDTLAFPSNIKNRVYCKFQIILNCFHHFHKHEGCGGNVSIIGILLCWRLPYYPTWKCRKWWWGTWQQSIWNWWFNAINWIWRNFAWWSWFRIRWNWISVRWHNHCLLPGIYLQLKPLFKTVSHCVKQIQHLKYFFIHQRNSNLYIYNFIVGIISVRHFSMKKNYKKIDEHTNKSVKRYIVKNVYNW